MNSVDFQLLAVSDYLVIVLRITLAVLIGGIIGLERRYRGSPVGFRTYGIVCIASTILMLMSDFQLKILPLLPEQITVIRTDPTRMAQGILTGMGFLGAGLVIKEKFSIRGLTTAAIMWLVTAEGILIGVGFYTPALLGLIVTLFVLFAHEQFENIIPTRHYAVLKIKIAQKVAQGKKTDVLELEQQLLTTIIDKNFFIKKNSFTIDSINKQYEFVFTVYSDSDQNYTSLISELKDLTVVDMVKVNYI